MVTLLINPIYTFYSAYLLGMSISPFKGFLGEVKQIGAHHLKGTTMFPMIYVSKSCTWSTQQAAKNRPISTLLKLGAQ